jgi:hypothetical protein
MSATSVGEVGRSWADLVTVPPPEDLIAALREYRQEWGGSQAVAQVPMHPHHDHLRWEPKPREARLRRRRSTMATTHQFSLPEHVICQRNSPSRSHPRHHCRRPVLIGLERPWKDEDEYDWARRTHRISDDQATAITQTGPELPNVSPVAR